MAAWVASGALLLAMLTGASYSYPAKGFNPSSHGSSYGTKHAPASATWDAPSSSGFAPAGSGSGAPARVVSSPSRPQPAQRRESSYPQPSVQREPAASYSAGAFAAPVVMSSGYASGPSTGSSQDAAWVIAPPGPFSDEETRPSAVRIASSQASPEPLGPSNLSPPGPVFQAGELSQYENLFEHGNYDSETEEQGFLPPPPGVDVLTGQDFTSEPQPSGPGTVLLPEYGFPYDYMFLMGQYPPGTVTHYSSSYEQGTDHWQDSHYIRDYYPARPSTQQVETFPADFEAPKMVQQPSQVPQSIQQPSQPVKQYW